MIRTVMFDVDDTVYSFHHANECAVAKLSEYTAENFGWDKEEFLSRQNPHALAMSNIYRDGILDNMIPEEGVEDWMRYLKSQNIRILIASDATAMQQFLKLERLGLISYVDAMVTSEEAGVEKPHPKFFERCNEKSKCRPNEVLFIGDNPEKDYSGASLAGYHALWYNPLNKPNDKKIEELRHFSEASIFLSNND